MPRRVRRMFVTTTRKFNNDAEQRQECPAVAFRLQNDDTVWHDYMSNKIINQKTDNNRSPSSQPCFHEECCGDCYMSK